MATETPELAAVSLQKESYASRLNTKIGLDEDTVVKSNEDNVYFYSTGDFDFILEKGFKPETLENVDITPVPFLTDAYIGIISIHGSIVPVVDIHKCLNSNKQKETIDNSAKTYLLKLEHSNYNPIIFKLDALPKLINKKELKRRNSTSNSPEWVMHYFENNQNKIAVIDHRKLFDAIIKTQ